jgi:hypothetical protein
MGSMIGAWGGRGWQGSALFPYFPSTRNQSRRNSGDSFRRQIGGLANGDRQTSVTPGSRPFAVPHAISIAGRHGRAEVQECPEKAQNTRKNRRGGGEGSEIHQTPGNGVSKTSTPGIGQKKGSRRPRLDREKHAEKTSTPKNGVSGRAGPSASLRPEGGQKRRHPVKPIPDLQCAWKNAGCPRLRSTAAFPISSQKCADPDPS